MAAPWLRLLALTAVLLASAAAPAAAEVQTIPTRAQTGMVDSLRTLESEVLVAVNELRRSRGLAPLRASRGLARAAEVHTQAMARQGIFAHELPGGPSFVKRVRTYYPSRGHRFWLVSENLVAASPTLDAAEAVEMWMGSPSHRRNLLSPQWREIGVSAVHAASAPGVFDGAETTFVTADFGVRR